MASKDMAAAYAKLASLANPVSLKEQKPSSKAPYMKERLGKLIWGSTYLSKKWRSGEYE
jgi:hypothetical protein